MHVLAFDASQQLQSQDSERQSTTASTSKAYTEVARCAKPGSNGKHLDGDKQALSSGLHCFAIALLALPSLKGISALAGLNELLAAGYYTC